MNVQQANVEPTLATLRRGRRSTSNSEFLRQQAFNANVGASRTKAAGTAHAPSALMKLMSPLRSTRAIFTFEVSSIRASSRKSSSRSCSEM